MYLHKSQTISVNSCTENLPDTSLTRVKRTLNYPRLTTTETFRLTFMENRGYMHVRVIRVRKYEHVH